MGFLAFTLTDEYAGTQDDGTPIFGGGQIAKIDGTTFDIGAEIEDGDGILVIEDNDPVADQLRALPSLRECEVPEAIQNALGDQPTEQPEAQPKTRAEELEDENVDDLRELAGDYGLVKGGNKQELIERIIEFEEADAEDASADENSSTEGDN